MKLYTSETQLKDFCSLLNKLSNYNRISTELKNMITIAFKFLAAQVDSVYYYIGQSEMAGYSTTVNPTNSRQNPLSYFFDAKIQKMILKEKLSNEINERRLFDANVDYVELFTLATAYAYVQYRENDAKICSTHLKQLVEFAFQFLTDDKWQDQLLQVINTENLLKSDKEMLSELYTAAINIKTKLQNENLSLINGHYSPSFA